MARMFSAVVRPARGGMVVVLAVGLLSIVEATQSVPRRRSARRSGPARPGPVRVGRVGAGRDRCGGARWWHGHGTGRRPGRGVPVAGTAARSR